MGIADLLFASGLPPDHLTSPLLVASVKALLKSLGSFTFVGKATLSVFGEETPSEDPKEGGGILILI
jgi:hypothetical protein